MDTLTAEQQETINQTKAAMRMSNEQYIRAHPELKHVVSCFMSRGELILSVVGG